ncbi:oligopeptide/dipeptide ABC transporter ATP-binding protein [Embleya sp. NPDC020886]|uniref:oligopeptide/dipeptide ABC transporter ATP-binding protein n=1 Tax=Embleya sp. NPDC020886 TaxID=3363980 RepID=UPI0037914FFE
MDVGSLVVDRLTVRFRLPTAEVCAVEQVSFGLVAGECLALVGESGCGKSVLAAALLGLLPANALVGGRAVLGGGGDEAVQLIGAPERTLARTVRGRRIGLVPQSPAARLTPVRTVRSQLEETVRELLCPERALVGRIAERVAARAAYPVDHLDRYPHQLSGGLAQRAAVALALVGDPWLIIADEPTTGLDRALVERTADELRRLADAGHAVLLVTHDLVAAERIADRVAVMYAGRIVEETSAEVFFGAAGPRHPYARGLLAALPEREFVPIPGMPPELSALPAGCAFAARCEFATKACVRVPDFVAGLACHHPRGDDRG